MFEDFRQREDGVVLDTDICVIGAGAAGITLARELAGSGREVLLVESGDREADAATLALNDGAIVGRPYDPLDTVRLRFFGGTTNHWDGHCRPLDPIDFEKRPWIPHSGWPISREELDPFYARAQIVCELGPYVYAAEHWWEPMPGMIHFDPERLVNQIWQYSTPTRFGERYGPELEASRNVRVLFNANVVEIVVNEAATEVTALRLKALDGTGGMVRPRIVVLACGGIENPRLLLASNAVMKPGLGNGRDLVGRFFMEHPHTLIAYAVPSIDITQLTAYYDGITATVAGGTATLQAKPGLSEAMQRAERLPNACIDIGYGYDRSEGYLSLREAYQELSDGEMSDELGEALLGMVSDLDGLAGGVYRRLREENVLWFGANAEQIPNPESRVLLDDECDALGSPRAKLDWRLSPEDKAVVRRACRIVGEELARLGIARMRIDEWLLAEDETWRDLEGRYHHMGTTRMSDDPRSGVVDRNCRVHGIANLYVSSCSVFPTGGYANPTLTIVALAIRLADHLKALGGG